ncbi:hypothetical protein PENTCL1PPCAC_14849, partial [Pristionchus entomophagus]
SLALRYRGCRRAYSAQSPKCPSGTTHSRRNTRNRMPKTLSPSEVLWVRGNMCDTETDLLPSSVC